MALFDALEDEARLRAGKPCKTGRDSPAGGLKTFSKPKGPNKSHCSSADISPRITLRFHSGVPFFAEPRIGFTCMVPFSETPFVQFDGERMFVVAIAEELPLGWGCGLNVGLIWLWSDSDDIENSRVWMFGGRRLDRCAARGVRL